MRAAVLAAALLAPAGALAAGIVSARYDPASIQWDQCRDGGEAVARLIGRQGGDAARENFRVTQRFDLDAGCRPERVALRLGRVSHASVLVPTAKPSGAGAGGTRAEPPERLPKAR